MTLEEISRVRIILGKHYSKNVVLHLNTIGMYNSDGNSFSSAAIRKIVNGFQPNDEVELEILKLTAKVAKLQAANEKKREALNRKNQ